MVLLDGISETGAHLLSVSGNLIYLRHLFKSTAVAKKLFSFTRTQRDLSYHLILIMYLRFIFWENRDGHIHASYSGKLKENNTTSGKVENFREQEKKDYKTVLVRYSIAIILPIYQYVM